MKIGFDIDGTLTDNSAWFNAVEKKFGLKKEDIHHTYMAPITKLQTIEFIEEYGEQIYSESVIEPGALQAVRKVNKKHEVFYITARDEKYKDTTINWLKSNGFPVTEDNVIFNSNKAEACKKYDIKMMVEDCAEHTESLTEEQILTFLIERPWNVNVETDRDWVVRVKNMDNFIFMFPAAEWLMGAQNDKKKRTGKKKNG